MTDNEFKYKEAFISRDNFSARLYFAMKNNSFPSAFVTDDIEYKPLLKKLEKEFKIAPENCFSEYKSEEGKKKEKLKMCMIEIEPNLMVLLSDYEDFESGPDGVIILYNHLTDENKKETVKKIILSCRKKLTLGGKIFLLQHAHHFHVREFELPDLKIDLKTNYNDDLEEADKQIIKRLNKKDDKGILFLYGKPGTGKTWYIRSLIQRVNKRMIFIPPDVAGLIGKPEFMQFLTHNSNAILIIEDAENLVMESAERKSVVSNLLNLSDGLLSDCFHIQVICTFNTDIHKIDKALLRKGRVIARYEFKALEKTKAQQLLAKNNSVQVAEHDMSLAEIYNHDEKDYGDEGQGKKLGFR